MPTGMSSSKRESVFADKALQVLGVRPDGLGHTPARQAVAEARRAQGQQAVDAFGRGGMVADLQEASRRAGEGGIGWENIFAAQASSSVGCGPYRAKPGRLPGQL